MSSSAADKRVILVTGANKGIGLEAVRQLSEQLPNARILLGTRSLPNGQAALDKIKKANPAHSYSNIQLLQLDVTDSSSIAAAAQRVKADLGQLDVLLNNSGITSHDKDAGRAATETLSVNLYGVHDMVEHFLPVLAPNATLVTVSSEVGSWTTAAMAPELQRRVLDADSLSWADIDALAQDYIASVSGGKAQYTWPPSSKTYGAYGVSKSLVSPYTRVVAREQAGKLKVAVVCPGYCATDLNANNGPRPASMGGSSVIFPILNDFQSGHFYQDGKEHAWVEPSSH